MKKKRLSVIPILLTVSLLILLFSQSRLAQADAGPVSPQSSGEAIYTFTIESVSQGYSLHDEEAQPKTYGIALGSVRNILTTMSNGLNSTTVPTNFIIVKKSPEIQLTSNLILCSTGVETAIPYYTSYYSFVGLTKLRANSGSLIVGYSTMGHWNPSYEYENLK